MDPLPSIQTKDLTPKDWPQIEKLFGSNGACGGCWCMSWRVEKGQNWKEFQGASAKRKFKKLVTTGKAHGALAFVGEEPVGWVSFDKRTDYPRLNRAPSLACDDAEKVWSIPCFFIKRGFRGKGVATALLSHALKSLKKRKAKIAEGYPVRPGKDGKEIPAAFAWTGTQRLFDELGFEIVGNRGGGKQRVRKEL